MDSHDSSDPRLLLSHANLLTMDPWQPGPYGLLHNHCLVINNGCIEAIVPSDQAATILVDRIVDLKGKWISPGIIDCHTHLIFAGSRAKEWEWRLAGMPYTDIARQGGGILNTVRATRSATEDDLFQAALPRLSAMIAEGITCVEIKSGYGLTLEDEVKMLKVAKRLECTLPVTVSTTLLAAHAIPIEYTNRSDDYVDLIINRLIPLVSSQQLAEAVDVFCENIAFSVSQADLIWGTARNHGLSVKGHVEQLSLLHGAKALSRHQPWSADHLEYLDEEGTRALSACGAVAVLLPGAFYFLREKQKPPLDALRKHQVPMAVATDFNPGTSPFASIRLAMNMACVLYGLSPEEALCGATRVAARALGRESTLGTLSVGKQADLLIWDIDHPADIVLSLGVNRLTARMYRGNITHGSLPTG